MSRIKLTLLSLLAVFFVSALASAAASAVPFEQKEKDIVLPEKFAIEGAGGDSVLESIIAKRIYVRCAKSVISGGNFEAGGEAKGIKLELKEACKIVEITAEPAAKEVELNLCKVVEPIKFEANEKLLSSWEGEYTGGGGEESFGTVEITGVECKLQGKYHPKGKIFCATLGAETEIKEHEILCNPIKSKMKIGTEEAKFFPSGLVIKLANKENWSAS